MHRLIAAFAAELRAHPLPAARTAAALLGPLADRRQGGAADGFLPQHLGEALSAAAQPLATQFAAVASQAPWIEVSGFPMPAVVRGRYSYCEIVGPEAPFPAEDIRFGAYLQFPDTWYPFHWHAAEELYFPLTGTALWSRNGVSDLAAAPGTLIRHAPYERHATRTGAEPMLALWVWLGDLESGSYGIDEM